MAGEAAEDLQYINKYKTKIIRAANKYGVQPSIVAGIISRETRGGRGAGLSNGWGDHGNAFGLMQVDKNWHTPRGEWDSQEHLDQGTEILMGCYNEVARKFPNMADKMKGALAAYNMGTERMNPNNVDAHTTHGNYSRDVTARAQYYARNGY
ncbi:lysozyme G-like [Scomber japonicus]|uniref:lysozyme G-like n=1 Tax=Scomber japonicus TaxID=13676 RepID=UPI002305EC02|nr:lysozyme G-like [Scomber japonicus]